MATNAADNWLLVLGLDFDPVTNDLDELKSVIETKKKEWSKKSTGPKDSGYYKKNLEKMDEIEKEVTKSERRRNELAEEAREIVYGDEIGRLDSFIRAVAKASGGDVEVEISSLEKVAEKVEKRVRQHGRIPDWEYSVEKAITRAKRRGYTVLDGEAGKDSAGAADKAFAPYADRRRWAAYKGLEKALANLGADDLYTLAFPGEGETARLKPSQALLDALKSLHDEKAVIANQEKSDVETAYNKAKEVFGSAEARKEYDEYLSFLEVRNVLGDLSDYAGINDGNVPEVSFKKAVEEIASAITDKANAELIVEGYCRHKKLRYHKDAAALYCRFGHVNSAESEICQECGLPLKVRCPKCGKTVESKINSCSCGEPIGSAIDEAMKQCELAERDIDSFLLDDARADLDKARKAWKGFPDILRLDKKIHDLESNIGPRVKQLRDLVAGNCYYEARDVLAGIRQRYPKFAFDGERVIEAKVDIAERALARAAKASSEGERANCFSQALDACADCKEALAYMQSWPPDPPRDIKVFATGGGDAGSVNITWSRLGASDELEYRIVRKEGCAPSDVTDGIELGTTKATRWLDETAESGREYYYAVFATRFGTVSSPCAASHPMTLLAEAGNVSVTPSDGAVDFSWDVPGDNASVEVWEESPSLERLVTTDRTFFRHSPLVNGRSYTYRIKVSYQVGGTPRYTRGVVFEATPIDRGQAIVDFRVKRDSEDSGKFHFSWSEKPGCEVLFYASDDKADIPDPESLMTMSELERRCSPVELAERRPGAATMGYGGATPLFVFPIVRFGETAVIGNNCRCSHEDEIKILDVYPANDDLAIRIDPPEQAVGFVVISRSDRFVRGIEENSHEGDQNRRTVTLKSYRQNGMLTIKKTGQRDYYLSVFAMYGSPVSPSFSEPSEYLFSSRPKNAIKYSVRAKGFRKKRIEIEFESDSGDFTLPATVVSVGVNGKPIFGNGIQVMHLPEQEVSGVLTVEVTGIPKRKNLYLVAMPADDGQGSYVETSGSNPKIS